MNHRQVSIPECKIRRKPQVNREREEEEEREGEEKAENNRCERGASVSQKKASV